MTRRTAGLLLAALGTAFGPLRAGAQPSRRAPEAALVSAGGQVGSLGGVTLRTPARTPASWTLLLGFDGAGKAVLGVNRQVERRLPASPLHVFAAPGAFVSGADGRISAGLDVGLGFGFYRHRYDVYVAVVPTAALVGQRDGRVDLGTGLRYAF